MLEIENLDNILIIGAGKSGIEAAKLLSHVEKNSQLYDENFTQESEVALICKNINIDATNNIDIILNKLKSKQFNLVVTSPGIPKSHPLHQDAIENDILIISELELAFHFCTQPIIAITGSNGKSTTTKLITDIINNSGQQAIACGNYGTPLSAFVLAESQPDYYVVEVSSFQLEWVYDFKPKVGIILNVQADHLDRHGSIGEYAATKMLLFKNMNSNDMAIAFKPTLNGFGKLKTEAPIVLFSNTAKDSETFYYQHNMICDGDKQILSLKDTLFDNKISSLMAIPAYITANFLTIKEEIVIKTIAEFQPLPHRTEFVRKYNDRIFIDDSKATNLGALEAALLMFGTKKNIILIAGGILKEKKLENTKNLLEKFVKKIYLIGTDGKVMLKAWERVVPCEYSTTLKNATEKAFEGSEKGDVILLSPACASFDQFSGYKERGEVFQGIANSF
jgi:UDP-N-acetylmuramoylalanine--D-glutamate ligase